MFLGLPPNRPLVILANDKIVGGGMITESLANDRIIGEYVTKGIYISRRNRCRTFYRLWLKQPVCRVW